MSKKIMFNDKFGLTQAVLEGRKTQTRRIITTNLYNRVDWKAFEEGNYDCVITDDASTATDIRDYAAYRVGEEVAVAQAYKSIELDLPVPVSSNAFDQKQAYHIYGDTPGWHNKMFVRADLMPHRIRITNVRVEHLQDISDEDCLKEGIYADHNPPVPLYNPTAYSYDADPIHNKQRLWFNSPREAFHNLINKTCGKTTWIDNPYVFVYDFELVK